MDELTGFDALGGSLEEAVASTTKAIVEELEPIAAEAFYRCVILRWFDVPTIAGVLAAGNVDHRGQPWQPGHISAGTLYEEMRRLPFVEVYRDDRLNIHDLTRTAMAAELWHERRHYYREVSAAAASYFEERLRVVRLADDVVEFVYHQLVADEPAGVDLVINEYEAGLGPVVVSAIADAVAEHIDAERLPPTASYLVPLGQIIVALDSADLTQVAEAGTQVMTDPASPTEAREWATLQLARSKRLSGDYQTSSDLLLPLWETGTTQAHRASAAAYLAEHGLDRGELEEASTWCEKALIAAVRDAMIDPNDPDSVSVFESAIRPQLLDANAWWATDDLFMELTGMSRDELLWEDEDERADEVPHDEHEAPGLAISAPIFALLQESRDRLTTRMHRWIRHRIGLPTGETTGDKEQTWATFPIDQLMASIWLTLAEVRRRRGNHANALDAAQLAGRMSALLGDPQGVMDAAAAQQQLGYAVADAGLSEASLDLVKLMVYEAREAQDPAAELAALIQLGASYQAGNRHGDARDTLTEALALAEQIDDRLRAASIHERLADIAVATSSWVDASNHVEQALDLYGEADLAQGLAWTLITKGDLERLRGRIADAGQAYEDALQQAKEIVSTDIERAALRGLGQSADARGDLEAASTFYEQAVKVTGAGPSDVVDMLRGLADVRSRLGDEESAQRYLRTAGQLVRQFDLRSKEADMAMSEGNRARAHENWTTALERYEFAERLFSEQRSARDVADAVLSQAEVYAQQDRHEDAANHARRALEITRAAADRTAEVITLQSLSQHLTYAGHAEEAIETAREATELDPEDAMSYGALGNALLQDKQFEESIAASQIALALDETQLWVVSNLGHAHLGARKPDEAERYFRRAIEHVRPDDDFEEDIKDIKRLLEQDPTLPRAEEFLEMFENAQATRTRQAASD